MPHLWIALSSHGLGHWGQTAPVVEAVRQRRPDVRLTVQSHLPHTVLQKRITGAFTHCAGPPDVGMVMHDALRVDATASVQAYRAFHDQWKTHATHQQALFQQDRPDVVLANVPYLPIAVAAEGGIPTVALCSLNWAAILAAYGEALARAALCPPIVQAYQRATVFLQPSPSMPMPELLNTQAIGPIATLGTPRRAEIFTRLHLAQDAQLILVALGGVPMQVDVAQWPHHSQRYWLIPTAWGSTRSDMRTQESLADMPFVDQLASCDALLTKSGYGLFVEAACHAKPVVYVDRPDWPEAPALNRWLEAHTHAASITADQLQTGMFQEVLTALLQKPPKSAVFPNGVSQAVDILMKFL